MAIFSNILSSRNNTGKGSAKVVELRTALTSEYTTDAHIQPCHSLSGDYRIKWSIIKDGVVTDSQISVLMLDIDFHDTEDVEAEYEKHAEGIDRASKDGWGFYTTRGGLRFFRPLVQPYPITVDTKKQWIAQYTAVCTEFQNEYGLEPDLACAEPMRLFRLPHVIRDGKKSSAVLQESSKPLALPDPTYRVIEEIASTPRVTTPINVEKINNLWDALLSHPSSDIRDLTKKAQKGELLSAVNRDQTAQRFFSTVAFLDRGETRPEDLADVFEGSIKAWAVFSEIPYEDKYTEVLDKLKRAQDDFLDAEARKEVVEQENKKAIKEEIGIPEPLIVMGRAYLPYNFNEQRFHDRFVTPQELPAVLRQIWPEGSPASHKKETKKGGLLLKTTAELTDQYGYSPNEVMYDYTLQKAEVRNKILHLPTSKLTRIVPERVPIVEEWLKQLTEDERLELWIAHLTRQAYPCAALYLKGQRGVGKTLLGRGLSQLWLKGHAKFENSLTRFNNELLRSPLWWLDEGVYIDSGANIGNRVRQAVGSKEFDIESKGQPMARLHGCPRILVTANNIDALQSRTNSNLTEADRAAAAERIVFIELRPQARAWLEKELNGRTNSFMIESLNIAKHALYLRDKYADQVGASRFLVAGSAGDARAADILSYRDDDELVVQWIVDFLEWSNEKRAPLKHLYIFNKGSLYLKAKAIEHGWDASMIGKHEKCPRLRVRNNVLGRMSGGAKSHRVGDTVGHYHKVTRETFQRVLESAQRDDIEEVLEVWDRN